MVIGGRLVKASGFEAIIAAMSCGWHAVGMRFSVVAIDAQVAIGALLAIGAVVALGAEVDTDGHCTYMQIR